MKTTKEMIAVMKAYERGEQIEFRYEKIEWCDANKPTWDWLHNDYHVKQKKRYVPFETAEEFLEAQRRHGGGLICIVNGHIFACNDVSISLNGHVFLHKRNKSGKIINFFL